MSTSNGIPLPGATANSSSAIPLPGAAPNRAVPPPAVMIPLPGSSPSSSIPLPGGDAQIPPPGAAAIPLPGSVPAPSLTTQAPGQGQYYVKDSGGRVLGPMPRAMVEELLKKGAIKADFEMRRTESAPWVPLSQETSFLPFLRSPGVGASSAERSITLEDAALPLLLLDLVRHGRTGNLRVIADGNDWTFQIKRGAIPFVNVTAGGPRLGDYLISEGIIDVATAQQALRLCGEQNAPFRTVLVNLGAISAAQDTASVTSWVQRLLDVACRAGSGAATFTGAPSADDDVDARADGLGQVRMAFDPARGFPVDVLQARLGEAQTVLRLTRELAPPGLTEGEQMAMERADGRTLGELVGELDAAGMDIGSAVAAVFMLVGLVVVERASSPSQSALAALRDQLGVNPDPFAALGVGRPDDVAAVMGALQLVSDEFARAAAGVAPHDPVRVQVEERLARIRSRVSSPLERHIYARAKGMGLDPESPAVRPVLEAEFLAKTVPQLLDGGQTARAHLLAERYYAIVPEDPTAIAFVGRCRFATAEDDSLKTEAVDFLIAQRDRFPTSIDIQLAVGVTGLAAGRMGTAKKALEFLTDKAGKDARVLAFQAKVQEAVSGRAPAVEQTSVKEVLEAAGSSALGRPRRGVVIAFAAGLLAAVGIFAWDRTQSGPAIRELSAAGTPCTKLEATEPEASDPMLRCVIAEAKFVAIPIEQRRAAFQTALDRLPGARAVLVSAEESNNPLGVIPRDGPAVSLSPQMKPPAPPRPPTPKTQEKP